MHPALTHWLTHTTEDVSPDGPETLALWFDGPPPHAFSAFAHDGDGNVYATWKHDAESPPAIVLLGHEGGVTTLAPDPVRFVASKLGDDITRRWPLPEEHKVPDADAAVQEAIDALHPPPSEDQRLRWAGVATLTDRPKHVLIDRGLLDGSTPIHPHWTFWRDPGPWAGALDAEVLAKLCAPVEERGGIRLSKVPSHGLAAVIGLRTKDLVRSVNGDPEVCTALRAPGDRKVLQVTRGSGKFALDWELTVEFRSLAPGPNPRPDPQPWDGRRVPEGVWVEAEGGRLITTVEDRVYEGRLLRADGTEEWVTRTEFGQYVVPPDGWAARLVEVWGTPRLVLYGPEGQVRWFELRDEEEPAPVVDEASAPAEPPPPPIAIEETAPSPAEATPSIWDRVARWFGG